MKDGLKQQRQTEADWISAATISLKWQQHFAFAGWGQQIHILEVFQSSPLILLRERKLQTLAIKPPHTTHGNNFCSPGMNALGFDEPKSF